MPTYDYQCRNCGERFEVEQKITDDVITQCAICNGGPVERLITGGTFVLKGTGWYKTDYGSSGRSSSLPPPKPSASSEKNEAGNTAVAKPEAPSSGTGEAKATPTGDK